MSSKTKCKREVWEVKATAAATSRWKNEKNVQDSQCQVGNSFCHETKDAWTQMGNMYIEPTVKTISEFTENLPSEDLLYQQHRSCLKTLVTTAKL